MLFDDNRKPVRNEYLNVRMTKEEKAEVAKIATAFGFKGRGAKADLVRYLLAEARIKALAKSMNK